MYGMGHQSTLRLYSTLQHISAQSQYCYVVWYPDLISIHNSTDLKTLAFTNKHYFINAQECEAQVEIK